MKSLCLVLFLIVVAGSAAAQPATDDSYTASSSTTTNFGTQPSVDVIGPGVNSYIRFDLTALPAGLTSSNVSKATMRLSVNGVWGISACRVHRATAFLCSLSWPGWRIRLRPPDMVGNLEG